MAKTTAKKKKTGAAKKLNSYVKRVDFKSMTPSERRVAIAQDVIAGVKAKRFIATQGTYVELPSATTTPEGEVCVQDFLDKNVKSCEVCAKGAMFIAAVEKFNRLKLKGVDNIEMALGDEASACDHLGKYFDRDTLDRIENIFEGDVDYYADDEESFADRAYAILYPEADDRLIAIMENIVANNGKFAPKIAIV